jgi:hypothetical protein
MAKRNFDNERQSAGEQGILWGRNFRKHIIELNF